MDRKRLKELRLKNDLTLLDIANLLGVKEATVQRYESGEIKNVKHEFVTILANLFNVSPAYLMGWDDWNEVQLPSRTINVPILGSVPAGVPIEAIEDILGHVELDANLAASGQFFALKISGDSMSPEIKDGDVVIVRRQPELESGEIGVVYVNGYNATCKKVLKNESGVILQPLNPSYDSSAFSLNEIASLPVVILGKVIEVRRFF